MAKISEYPPITAYDDKTSNRPFSMFFRIKDYPNLNFFIENDKVILNSYKKSFWGRKKLLGLTIEKIDDPDDITKHYDGQSNGKIFGMEIIEKRKVVYRALYDLGLMHATFTYVKNQFLEKVKNNDDVWTNLAIANSIDIVLDIHTLIEKLFI